MRSSSAFVAGGIVVGGAIFAITVMQTVSVPPVFAQEEAAVSEEVPADASTAPERSLRDLTKIVRSPDQIDELPSALEELEAMVAAGDADAALLLGNEYTKDRGTLPVDYNKAVEYLEKAAELGKPDVYLTLATLHQRELGGLAQPEALKYLKLAADAGVTKALMPLADAYRKGSYGEPDITAAISYYEAALEAGEESAVGRLTAIYRSGTGSPDDAAMEIKYLKLAAEQGDVGAMRSLAKSYLRGQDVEQDLALSESYLQSAVKAGDDSARSDLATSLVRGQYGEGRETEGVALMQSAYDDGDVSVAASLADAYIRGRGADTDIAKGVDILKSASENGNMEARLELLDIYVRGSGRDLGPDLGAARALYETIPQDMRSGNTAAAGAMLAAYGSSREDHAAMWALFKDLDPRLKARTGTQILRISENSYVYMLQNMMGEEDIYSGDLDGMLTSSTISAVNQYCANYDITVECRFGPLARTTWEAISEKVLSQ